jgi:uncharacterized protein
MLFRPFLIQRKKIKKTPEDFGILYEDVVFNSPDGLLISGWIIPAVKETNKTIIIGHGVNMFRGFMLPKILFLHQAGYNLVLYDSRAHGKSEGDYVTFGYREQHDLDAVIDYLKKVYPAWTKKLGVLAHSMGAAAAIFAAKRRKELKAFVLINCFADIEEDIIYWVTKMGHLPYWPFVPLGIKSFKKELKIDLKKVSPVFSVAEIKRPIFFINSEKDDVTNPQDTVKLYESAEKPKMIWTIKNAKHETFYDVAKKEFEKRVKEFFKENL